jgi:hypothetical protein
MNSNEFAEVLGEHLTLCREILALAEREAVALRTDQSEAHFELYQTKKALLPRLNESLEKIRVCRKSWQGLNSNQRAAHPGITPLLRENQDLIMKIIVLDRENEQTLLRRGMVPTRHIPSANRQRPHFVADMYRRSGRN